MVTSYFDAYADRSPDARVADALAKHLPPPSSLPILDLGGGTGGYAAHIARRGYNVVLVDSSAQQLRRAPGSLPRILADAGALPLGANEAAACYSILALHQFRSLENSLSEAARVTGKSSFCALTFDRHRAPAFWLGEYFPEVWFDAYPGFPNVEHQAHIVSKAFGQRASVLTFPIPRDLKDAWLPAGWHRPELYLDQRFRAKNSSFHRVGFGAIERGAERLSEDLASGAWNVRYGHLRHQDEVDAGYFFIIIN